MSFFLFFFFLPWSTSSSYNLFYGEFLQLVELAILNPDLLVEAISYVSRPEVRKLAISPAPSNMAIIDSNSFIISTLLSTLLEIKEAFDNIFHPPLSQDLLILLRNVLYQLPSVTSHITGQRPLHNIHARRSLFCLFSALCCLPE